jgi:hypothetical protein
MNVSDFTLLCERATVEISKSDRDKRNRVIFNVFENFSVSN